MQANSSTATPFQTYEWQETWWNFYGTTIRPVILTAWVGDQLCGIWPLGTRGGTWRTLRPLGKGASDYLHPLMRDGFDVWSCFMKELAKMQEAHLLDLHQIRETWFQADVDGQLLEQARCLVLDLPASYDEYVATLGKSLRYDVKKLDRLVASDDSVSIRPVIEETLTEGMDSFFRLHRLRWRKRLQPGAFSAKAEAFHREWSQKALKNGWLWMSTMEVDSLAVGSIYAMRLGDACFFYQAGFDPTAKALSPGTLLVASTIRRSIEKGLKHFDFLRGAEAYKRRWKPQHEYRNLRLILSRPGMQGNFGAAWNNRCHEVEMKVRERLEGKSLL